MYIVLFRLSYIYLSLVLGRSVLIKRTIDISDKLELLYFVKKLSEHRYDIRVFECCVDPNP